MSEAVLGVPGSVFELLVVVPGFRAPPLSDSDPLDTVAGVDEGAAACVGGGTNIFIPKNPNTPSVITPKIITWGSCFLSITTLAISF
jgi:hypothetical protein